MQIRIRNIFWSCLTAAALPSCGSGASGVSTSSDAVAICTPPPATGAKVRPDTSTDFAVWVGQHPDLFAGVWWDSVRGDYVFSATDPGEARTLIKQQFPAEIFRVDAVPRGASALRVLQQRVLNITLADASVSSSRRAWDGRIQIEFGVLDQPAIAAVEREFAGELDGVCVTGADVASIPQPGSQPRSGPGWRLLADPIAAGQPYHVNVALSDVEYETLWNSLDVSHEPPIVNFTSEIVIQFTAGIAPTCPEQRLDGVKVDHERSVVSPEIVSLTGVPTCTALGEPQPRTYLLALTTSSLPSVPFTVSLSGDVPAGSNIAECRDCEQVTILNP